MMHRHVFSVLLITSLIGSCVSSTPPKKELDVNQKVEYSTAMQELATRAEQGNSDAQVELGYRHLVGNGVPKIDQLAFKWTKLAADQGLAAAQYNLARMHETGDGAFQSYKAAVYLYKLSADQGFVSAQRNLGVMYWSGKGTMKDYVRGLTWMNIAAHFEDDESFKKSRKVLEKRLTLSEINLAQQKAQKWIDEHIK